MSQLTRIAVLVIVAALGLMLGITALAAGSPAAPAPQMTGVAVSGRVFHDLNMDGVATGDEPGVDGAQVQLLDAAGNAVTGQIPVFTSDVDGGAFTFFDVAPGTYRVVEDDSLSKVSTSFNPVEITVAGAPMTDVNFGLVLKLIVGGRVYTDGGDADGYNLYGGDELLVGATVKIIDDVDVDGFWDAGESILGSAISDGNGFFNIADIVPGDRILAVQPAEMGGVWGEPAPLRLEASALGGARLGDVSVAGAPAAVSGIVWNDVDGDEIVELGEPRLAGVTVEVHGAVAGQTLGDPPLAAATTDANGHYQASGLSAGYPYEVRPVGGLPAGWLMSTAPAALVVTPNAAGPNGLNIGYYDPLAVAPMRQSDWKKELRQAGQPRYTPAQIDGFIAAIEAVGASAVFDEVGAGVRAVLLNSPIHGDLGQALKEYAVLRLNLASSRLYAATAVSLPELTTATTIGAVVAEIEGILAPGRTLAPTKDDYQRVRQLAEALNSGKGLGSGLTGVFALASGTYRGASVVTKLRPGGDLVDLGTDAPAYLLKWSPGVLASAINVTDAQVRIKVKVFMDDGILEVVQVLPDGRTAVLGTIVPPVWNKDLNATYTLSLRGVSTAEELTRSELRLITRDAVPGGRLARVRIDSAELVFKH